MTPRFTYAGVAERLLAKLLDGMILVVFERLLVSLVGAEEVALLILFLFSAAYYTYFVASDWQATPGKRILGLYITMADGRKPTQVQAFERHIVYVLPQLALYTSVLEQHVAQTLFMWLFVVWFAPILFTDDRRGVHDTLVGTRVVLGKAGVR